MTKSFRKWLALSFLLTAHVPGLAAAASSDNRATSAQITIRVYDYAEVASGTRARAGKMVRKILGQAGVETAWVDCSLPESEQPPACSAATRPTELILRILPGSKAARTGLGHSVCGYAARPAGSGAGTLITLLYDCVKEIAAEEGLSRARILGHMVAHEVGHLLLPTGKNARTGIMRGRLRTKEWKRAAMGDLLFTPPQAAQLRDGVQARSDREEAVRMARLAPTR